MDTSRPIVSAINWFGGKSRHLTWLLPLLDTEHTHYIEPCAGSAVVFLNKKPSPIETISDAHGRLINFFRVLRERPDEIIHLLELTAYSRAEFEAAKDQAEDSLEDARRMFVLCMMSYGGRVGTSRESWRMSMKDSRRGLGLEVSKFQTRISRLYAAVERLRMAQIDCRDVFYMMSTYDGRDALFYIDFPYKAETRTSTGDYQFEFSDDDHERALLQCRQMKAKIALSTYDNEMYADILKGWHRQVGPDRMTNLGKTNKREILYTNYMPQGTLRLFE